ncbi:MAG: PEP-CTERM sorting domain-containing protein [Myxococcota bacterium]
MRIHLLPLPVLLFVLAFAPTALATTVYYQATSLGGSSWRLDYTVVNDTLAVDVEEITIWFDATETADLTAAIAPSGWDPLAIPADPLLFEDGFYDALALGVGIAPGASLAGFSVELDYLGVGAPGAQYFEIVDAFDPSIVLDSGTTVARVVSAPVPEPGAALLMLVGIGVVASRRRLPFVGGVSASRAGLPIVAGVVLLVGLMATPEALAQSVPTDQVEVTNMELVGRARRSRVHFAYTWRVTFANVGDALTGVEGLATVTGPGLENDSTAPIALGDLAANASVTIEDALTLVVDRRVPFDPTAIAWQFVADPPAQEPAALEVVPPAFDFGAPVFGCPEEQQVVLRNTGDVPIVLTDIACPDCQQFLSRDADRGDFFFDVSFDFRRRNALPGFAPPWTLPPGGEWIVPLTYRATSLGGSTASIVLTTDIPGTPVITIDAVGTGTPTTPAQDAFVQGGDSGGQVDILFTMDRSGSMSDDLQAVIDSFTVFVDELVAAGNDFHLAAVVADDGCVVGPDPFLDNGFEAAAAQAAIDTMIDLDFALSSYGMNTERGFMLAEAALSEANRGPGGCNEGFLRDEARLATVHISDEPEQSINSFVYYVDTFRLLKSDPLDLTINAVAGDYPSGCGRASAGTGYYEAKTMSGGQFFSICTTDWGAELAALATSLDAGLTTSFPLSSPALAGTVRVRIDGVEASDWLLRAFGLGGSNSVVHFPNDEGVAPPPAGSVVEIDYYQPGTCS